MRVRWISIAVVVPILVGGFYCLKNNSVVNHGSVSTEVTESNRLSLASSEVKAPKKAEPKFESLLQEVYQSLPSTDQLANLSNSEAHHTPKVLVIAAERLGDVAQHLHDHPEFADEAAIFYKKCSMDERLPASIRALCLADLKAIVEVPHEDLAKLPNDVIEISEKL